MEVCVGVVSITVLVLVLGYLAVYVVYRLRHALVKWKEDREG